MTQAPPPFKLATTALFDPAASNAAVVFGPEACCEPAERDEEPAIGRTRLAALDAHLHCSVIGTCLTTAELRKLMARFIDVGDADDLAVHHEAVRLVSDSAVVAKAVHKALDQRHAAVVQRFAKTREAAALAELWRQSLRQGEIPGAYWAVLTHRDAGAELRKAAFGEVHMLSHLVGAANRADIRRLVALEADNAGLRERLDAQQERTLTAQAEAAGQRHVVEQLQQELRIARDSMARVEDKPAPRDPADAGAVAYAVAVQTERRERAEQAAAAAFSERSRLEEELAHLREHAAALGRELAAAEAELGEEGDRDGRAAPDAAPARLQGQRILYVGGRPSTAPSIRALALRRGAEFQRHGGSLEDRRGLLAGSVAWATVVVFPVDCIDHDSATNLKRLCMRQGVAFMALRSAGVASFAAALAEPQGQGAGGGICLGHG